MVSVSDAQHSHASAGMGKEGLTIVAGSCMLDPEDGMRLCHDVRVHSKQQIVETETLVDMTKVSWYTVYTRIGICTRLTLLSL